MIIKGKNALITGGANRIGREITLGLARSGANVAINYFTSESEAKRTLDDALELGVEAISSKADISKIYQVSKMVDLVAEQLGTIDIFIHSAAPFIRTPFPVSTLDDWHTVINTMVNGSFYCANSIAPYMINQGSGAMIFILDLSALEPMRNYIAHSIGKASILALSKQLAVELAPNVRVNSIVPGHILPPEELSDETIIRLAKKNLLRRWGDPSDIVKTVMFLLESGFINGEMIIVDGGERLTPS